MSYKILRERWLQKNFELPELPENSGVAQRLFAKLEQLDRLQDANLKIRERMRDEPVERRGIIHYERNAGYGLWKNEAGKKQHSQLLQEKRQIQFAATYFEQQALDIFMRPALKKELQGEVKRLKNLKTAKKKEQETTANHAASLHDLEQAIVKLDHEITTLETFLKEIETADKEKREPKIAKTIKAFATEQVRDGLDPQDIAAADEENAMVAYAKDRNRQSTDQYKTFKNVRTFKHNGQAYEASFEYSDEGVKCAIARKYMMKNKWDWSGFSKLFPKGMRIEGLNAAWVPVWMRPKGECWGAAEREAHIRVFYDELVKNHEDIAYSDPSYTENPSGRALSDQSVRSWKRKYTAQMMAYVLTQAHAEIQFINNHPNAEFKQSFMTFDDFIEMLEKNELDSKIKQSKKYQRELDRMYEHNHAIHVVNSILAKKDIERVLNIEWKKDGKTFNQAIADKTLLIQARDHAERVRDRIATVLDQFSTSYTTFDALNQSLSELYFIRQEGNKIYDKVLGIIQEKDKGYSDHKKTLPENHPELLVLQYELEQAKISAEKAKSALEELNKVICRISENFSEPASAQIKDSISPPTNLLTTLTRILVKDKESLEKIADILTCSEQSNSEQLVQQALMLNPEKTMCLLNSAYETLIGKPVAEVKDDISPVIETVDNAVPRSPASLAAHNAIVALTRAMTEKEDIEAIKTLAGVAQSNSEGSTTIDKDIILRAIQVRPVVSLLTLNTVYARLKDPVRSEASGLAHFVAQHLESANKIREILKLGPTEEVTAARINEAHRKNQEKTQQAIDAAIAVANPAFIAQAIDKHPQAKAAVASQVKNTKRIVQGAKSKISLKGRQVGYLTNDLPDINESPNEKYLALYDYVYHYEDKAYQDGLSVVTSTGGLRIKNPNGSFVEMSVEEARENLKKVLASYESSLDALSRPIQRALNNAQLTLSAQKMNKRRLEQGSECAKYAQKVIEKKKEEIQGLMNQLKDPAHPLGSLFAGDSNQLKSMEEEVNRKTAEIQELETKNKQPENEKELENVVNNHSDVRANANSLEKARKELQEAQATLARLKSVSEPVEPLLEPLRDRLDEFSGYFGTATECVEELQEKIKERSMYLAEKSLTEKHKVQRLDSSGLKFI